MLIIPLCLMFIARLCTSNFHFPMAKLQLIYLYSGNSANPKKPDVASGDALAVMDFSGFD